MSINLTFGLIKTEIYFSLGTTNGTTQKLLTKGLKQKCFLNTAAAVPTQEERTFFTISKAKLNRVQCKLETTLLCVATDNQFY